MKEAGDPRHHTVPEMPWKRKRLRFEKAKSIIRFLMPRTASKRDLNHQKIRDGLRELGRPVLDLGSFPGCLDLLTQHVNGELVWLEIKSKGGTLTDSEAKRLDEFEGARVYVVYTLKEAANHVGITIM